MGVCRTPIILTQRLKSLETGDEKIEVAFKRDGQWQTAIYPRSTIFSSRSITTLADLGCTVTSEAAKKAVAAALESAKGGDGAQAGAQSDSASFKPGTYEGSAKGFGGDVTATVVVGDTGIESVELNGSGETPELGGEALKKLGPAFAEAGSADVDGVAGCTVTSEAAKKAVQAALDQAK